MASHGCEGCKLSGTGCHRHPRMALRLVMRQVDDIVVISHNSLLSSVSSYLVVTLPGRCTLLEVQASQDGVLAETLLDG